MRIPFSRIGRFGLFRPRAAYMQSGSAGRPFKQVSHRDLLVLKRDSQIGFRSPSTVASRIASLKIRPGVDSGELSALLRQLEQSAVPPDKNSPPDFSSFAMPARLAQKFWFKASEDPMAGATLHHLDWRMLVVRFLLRTTNFGAIVVGLQRQIGSALERSDALLNGVEKPLGRLTNLILDAYRWLQIEKHMDPKGNLQLAANDGFVTLVEILRGNIGRGAALPDPPNALVGLQEIQRDNINLTLEILKAQPTVP